MSKLIESLCGEFPYKRSSKIKDSAASTREAVNQFYVDTFGESYDDSRPSPYGFWCDKFDVEALGKKWPNGDKSKSELLYIPSTNLDVVSFPETLSGDPESLMIVVQSTADALGLDYKYMFPGYYYVDSANNEIIDLGSIDQVKKWVASLEPLEGVTPISGEEEDKMWDHLRKFRRSHNL